MRVLVTGAAGFLGSNLVDVLLRDGHDVLGLDNFDPTYDPERKRRNLWGPMAHPRFELVEADVLDTPCLRTTFGRWRPEAVVHLAARVSNRRSLRAGLGDGYFGVNVGGTVSLLSACEEARPRSLVYVSTGNIYDDAAPAPFREGFTPDRPRTPYAQSKRLAEILVLETAEAGGPPATILRLFTAYGPHQRPDMVHSRFVEALLSDRPLEVIGSGSDLRDYIHVSDACALMAACLKREASGEVINGGSGRGTTLDSLIALLARLTRHEAKLLRVQPDARDTRVLLADIAKAARLLDWRPRIALEDGLLGFIDWFKKEGRPLSGGVDVHDEE